MSNELVPIDDDFDIGSVGEPNQEVIVHKGGRKSTGSEYQQRVNEALEMILYQKLAHKEFRSIYAKTYNVSEKTADLVWKRCKEILKERYEQKNEEIISEQLSRYQDLLNRAREDGNKRVERETLWDMSRIMGLDQRKLDITSDGMPLDIRINLSNAPRD
ncbi:hypothetical protein UFOVP185_5 [uncultured Caudovirales phage]|uniref:Uncharacterized protein n=1 Tax=uncultured Caudovirales phage TaxID=2100421 RepID=A0A6J7WJN0_9CAUD|nr:hypothetical protein UFOVP185_5 [uncultured Caudovirales phage]